MVQNTVAKVSNYSLTKIADFRARVIENRIDGLHLELNGIPLHVRLVGKFNASNHNYLVKLRSAEKPKQVTVNGSATNWSHVGDVISIRTAGAGNVEISVIQ